MPDDPRWCAERPDGQVTHGLTWDELNADETLTAIPCPAHGQPRRWPGGVLDITGTVNEQADYEP